MHPEQSYREQWDRVERLIALAQAQDETEAFLRLDYYDVLIITFQALWNLKDWILNDPSFGAKDPTALRRDIFESEPLMVCSDLANGTKHFRLDAPKTTIGISDRFGGLHFEPSRGIYQHFVYLSSADPSNKYRGMEARDFLQVCKVTWESIINKHYLSYVDV